MLEKIAKKLSKATAGFLAVTMLGNGCAAEKISSWKPESVVDTKYEKVGEEVGREAERKTNYEIAVNVTENLLNIQVTKGIYDVVYDVLKPTQIERQQEYQHTISRTAWLSSKGTLATGIGLLGTGLIIRLGTGTFFKYDPTIACGDFPGQSFGGWFLDGPFYSPSDEEYDAQTQEWYDCYTGYTKKINAETALVTTGASMVAFGIALPFVSKKDDRPVKNYRDIEVPLNAVERKPRDLILNNTVPAINIAVGISTEYFTISGRHQATLSTNSGGSVIAQLESVDTNFAFSLGDIVNTDVAARLRKAGYRNAQFLGTLQETALPISYDVSIKTNATDGVNVTVKVPIKGYVINESALERVVMGL